MAGFIRRFGYVPGLETITLIEGVIILDLPPPGSISGVSSGVVALVGEFPDMTYATSVDSVGVVSTKAVPVEVMSGADMAAKVGEFDATLGSTGITGGNGFIALRNKKFSRLVLVPVNLASAGAGRAWRDLPTNLSATQAQPVVPMSGGSVSAGREFRNAANPVRLGKLVNFTALGHYKSAIDGASTTGAPAASATWTSAGGGFLTGYNGGPIPKGAIVVIGQIGGAGALGTNAGSYRVQAAATVDTTLTLEKLDGSSFFLTTGTAQPFRIHPQSDADSGGFDGVQASLADTSGYKLPCRPTAATIASGLSCTPAAVPSAGTASSWDPLSGLTLRSHVSAGFIYTATVQAPNAVNDATIDALYATAIDGLLGDQAPQRDVNILVSARTGTVSLPSIPAKLKSHVLAASGLGVGRIAVIAPPLTTVSVSTVTGDTAPGVGANRDERVFYSWPGEKTYVPEAVNVATMTAASVTTLDGMLDVAADVRLASLLSNLPPERNPGQASAPVPEVMSTVAGFQRNLPVLGMSEYIALKAAGICGLRMDRTSGPIFQSGVTTSLVAGLKTVARRRMADFIQDSVSQRLVQYSKEPLTEGLKESMLGEVDAFLNGLKSPNNKATARINDYSVDDVSGNTPAMSAQGVHVIIGRVRTTPTADYIVFQTEVGEGVVITRSV
jgi:hypothetical protein